MTTVINFSVSLNGRNQYQVPKLLSGHEKKLAAPELFTGGRSAVCASHTHSHFLQKENLRTALDLTASRAWTHTPITFPFLHSIFQLFEQNLLEVSSISLTLPLMVKYLSLFSAQPCILSCIHLNFSGVMALPSLTTVSSFISTYVGSMFCRRLLLALGSVCLHFY